MGSLTGQVLETKQLHVVVWLSVPDAQRVRRGQAARIRQGDSPPDAAGQKTGTVPLSSGENHAQSPGKEGYSPSFVGRNLGQSPRYGGQSPQSTGTVIFVGSAADPQTGSLPVRVLVDNAQRRLTLGQVVSVSIAVGEKTVLAVPAAAVHDLGEGPLVSVVREGKIVVLHPRVGLADGRWVEVERQRSEGGRAGRCRGRV